MSSRAKSTVRTCRLGQVEYVETARLQRSLRAAREAGAVEDVLLLLEHDPVITCGTRTEDAEIAYARTTGIPLVPVERGGKATYHGPGQVVAYPIFSLARVDDDVKELVRRLEEAIIVTYEAHGVTTARRDGFPGVWVDPELPGARKIASVGLRLTRGITFHGIALNVACDLEPFSWFTPCGIPDADMTSLVRELNLQDLGAAERAELVRSVEQRLADAIFDQFDATESPIGLDDLQLLALRHPVEDPKLALPEAGAQDGPIMRVTRIDLDEVGLT
ncbi:MAG: lipoate-protein ligase [Thermoleophilia bacterium]|nr:lipoate-protein ligase [Thermoleophilia bacterium]MCZ4496904.1 lipoate-protein ligase [Thermoleophilia bacterium]